MITVNVRISVIKRRLSPVNKTMKFFDNSELKAILIIFTFLVVISTPNFIVSLRRARDAQRKADIGSIHDSLLRYQSDFGSFPLSIDGKIAACEPVSYKEVAGIKTPVFSACDWGKTSLADLSDSSYPPYLKLIPSGSYYYFSNGSKFQIYGSLEGKIEDGYDESIIKRGIVCGPKICNFGKSSGRTPLDISIEEYETKINK
jgi:type II secretory pathway pseudopilin PulG